MRTRTRALVPAVLVAAALVGCGGAARSGPATAPTAPAATAPASAAEPGAGAAYAPRDVASSTSRRSEHGRVEETRAAACARLEQLHRERAGPAADPRLHAHRPAPGRVRRGWPDAAFAGEAAVIIVPGEDSPGASAEAAKPHILAYDAVTDHVALERWLAGTAERSGDDGEFALYTSKRNGGFVSALSDSVVLTGSRMEDLRAGIERAGAGQESLNDDAAFRAALGRLHDERAGIVGYSRGEIVDTMTFGLFGEHAKETQVTTALGLAEHLVRSRRRRERSLGALSSRAARARRGPGRARRSRRRCSSASRRAPTPTSA